MRFECQKFEILAPFKRTHYIEHKLFGLMAIIIIARMGLFQIVLVVVVVVIVTCNLDTLVKHKICVDTPYKNTVFQGYQYVNMGENSDTPFALSFLHIRWSTYTPAFDSSVVLIDMIKLNILKLVCNIRRVPWVNSISRLRFFNGLNTFTNLNLLGSTGYF